MSLTHIIEDTESGARFIILNLRAGSFTLHPTEAAEIAIALSEAYTSCSDPNFVVLDASPPVVRSTARSLADILSDL